MVLIVDDNTDIRELMKRALVKEGFIPEVAGNGREALNLIEKGVQPSLIFLDSKMDVMNGQEFLDLLERLQMQKPIRVVVMSGSESPLHSHLIIETIKKPLDLSTIRSLAAKYATRRPESGH